MNTPGRLQLPLAPEAEALTQPLSLMPVAAMITDTYGAIEWVNPHFTKMTGFSAQEMVGCVAWLQLGAADAAAGPERLRGVVEMRKPWTGEVHVPDCNGPGDAGQEQGPRSGACRMEQTISPIRDASGAVAHALWTLRKVSRENRAAAELGLLQEIFTAAEEAARFGVFRWNVKTGLSEWSPATYRLYGLDANTEASYANWLTSVFEEDRPATLAAIQRTMEDPNGRLEVQYRAADGLRWITCSGKLFRDAQGNPDYMVGISLDRTEHVRMEQALRLSEERLALAIDAASDGIWDWNAETNQVFFSTAWKRMLGYENDEVSGDFQKLKLLVHPDDLPQLQVAIRDHWRGETEQYIAEFRMRCKDGSWKWILARGKAVTRYPDGAPLRVVGAHTDINRQKQLETELREREEKARSLFRNLGEGVAYCRMRFEGDTPVDWLHEEVNEAYAGLTGLDDATGKWASDLMPGLRERHPELLEIYGRVCRSGKAEHFEHFLEPFDSWYAGTIYGGPPDHFVVVFQNVTEKKKIELALVKSHDLLSNLARLVPGVIYQYRLWPDGRSAMPYSSPGLWDIFEVNPEDVREDASVLLGRQHPEDTGRVMEAIFDSARRLETFHCEFRVILPKQGLRWLSSRAQPQRTVDGGTLWHGIILDVTERKNAEVEREKLTAQLIQSRKMESVGRLAGGVAHDFNNMLTVISGYSGILMSKLEPDNPLFAYVQQIRNAGERATGLTKQLLAFSRNQIIEPRLVNINTVIREVVPMLGTLIGEDMELRTHLGEELGYAMADPDQIHQVIMNLAINARDAMPDGGKLDISTANVELSPPEAQALDPDAVAGPYVMLAVADSGTGMDEETLRQIFEPFFTTKEVGKGTGLGLATVFGIVKQNSGWIDVRTTPAVGTRFRVYLPRVDACEVREVKAPDELSCAGHETILIVEDHEGVRAYTQMVLQEQGYEVLEASGAEEALRVADEYSGRIHLLLTDVVLPGMNGRTVSERLQELYPLMRVIFCSGYTADLISQRGVMQHGTSFLQKPFQPENLLKKVREVLDPAGHLPN